jgi:hypothetical protein
MNVTAWLKQRTSNYFRQIVKIERIEFCSSFKSLKSISWLDDIVNYANLTFPQFVHACPYRGVFDSILTSPIRFQLIFRLCKSSTDPSAGMEHKTTSTTHAAQDSSETESSRSDLRFLTTSTQRFFCLTATTRAINEKANCLGGVCESFLLCC